jgi:hypothetical protein
MLRSDDATVESRMIWQQCLVQLIVGGSALAGAAVIMVQVLPPLLNGLPY